MPSASMVISWEQLSLSLEVNVDSSYSSVISQLYINKPILFEIFSLKNFRGFHSPQKFLLTKYFQTTVVLWHAV